MKGRLAGARGRRRAVRSVRNKTDPHFRPSPNSTSRQVARLDLADRESGSFLQIGNRRGRRVAVFLDVVGHLPGLHTIIFPTFFDAIGCGDDHRCLQLSGWRSSPPLSPAACGLPSLEDLLPIIFGNACRPSASPMICVHADLYRPTGARPRSLLLRCSTGCDARTSDVRPPPPRHHRRTHGHVAPMLESVVPSSDLGADHQSSCSPARMRCPRCSPVDETGSLLAMSRMRPSRMPVAW